MARKKTVAVPEAVQARLVPDAAPEWDDQTIPLDTLPFVYEAPPKSLVDSVARFGVLQPIIVQADMTSALLERPGPVFHIIAGRRRVAAARAAKLAEIPARILKGAAGDVNPDVILLIENAERSANVAAEARAIQALVATRKADGSLYGPKDIAQATGMKIATVKKRMALLTLHPDLLQALEEGTIKPTVAEAAAKLGKAQQANLVDNLAEDGKITLESVQDQRRVTVSGTVQATLAGIVGGMGGGRQQATQAALYGRAMVHLERFRLELPEGVPQTILDRLDAIQEEVRRGIHDEHAADVDGFIDLPDDGDDADPGDG